MSMEIMDLETDEKARGYAKIYSAMIEDEYQRKRANAAITALGAYVNLLKNSQTLTIQNSMTLYRNPELCSQFEIADFYVNNYHIDVRVTVEDDKVIIPKIHYENNITPDFYVVVKIDKDLKNLKLLGIIETAAANLEPCDLNYYIINSSSFISHNEFIEKVKNKKQDITNRYEHENFKNNYLSFIDNETDNQQRIEILQHLFQCAECRAEFCCFTGFEMVSCNASNYPEILEDKTLEIIGAQISESEENKNKEQTVYIGKDDDDFLTELDDVFSETKEDDSTLDELFDENDEETAETNNVTEREIVENSTDDLQIIEEEEKDNNELAIIEDESEENLVSIEEDKLEEPQPDTIININEDEMRENSAVEHSETDDEPELQVLDYDEETVEIAQEETVKSEDKTEEINEEELDIMDQMFVDGALEREAREQQPISYSNLKTPYVQQSVDNNIVKEDNNEITEIIEEEEEPLQEYDIENTENKEGENTIVEDEELKEEEPKEEEKNLEENSENEDNEEEQEKEHNDDELLSALPSGKGSTIQMFDGYIENELAKNTDNEQESEEKEDGQEEYDEDEDEDISDDDEEGDYDMNEGNTKKSSLKNIIITISIIAALLLICGLSAFFYLKNNSNNTEVIQPNSVYNEVQNEQPSGEGEILAQTENYLPEIQTENTQTGEEQTQALEQAEENVTAENEVGINEQLPTEKPVVKKSVNKTESDYKDINKAITKALSAGDAPVRMRGLSWFCSSELFSDRAFKAYMQNLDNTLKQNLKGNILLATQIPDNNSVTVKLAVDNERNLRKVLITESSGSEEVDEIVLRSINETFEGEKSPILSDSPLKSDIYYLKVVIKF